MLQIESTFGSETDMKSLKASSQQITNIMQHTIINTGDGNTVNTGDKSKVNSTVTINKGDFQALTKKLEELGIQKVDIENLNNVIQSDPVDYSNKRYGPEVNKWLKSMLEKAIYGSWQISLGTAGGVLAEIINSYYGIK